MSGRAGLVAVGECADATLLVVRLKTLTLAELSAYCTQVLTEAGS